MKEVKKRILWVDIAKAFAILSVIISHTLPTEWTIRTMIFSIHMPLFFILSGFTTHPAEDWKNFFKRLKKNLKCLIVPAFAVLLLFIVYNTLTSGGGFFGNLKYWLHQFFIERYPDGFQNVSAVWFLIALFWAKLFIDIVNVIYKSEKNGIILFLLGAVGIYLGISESRPPFFLDLGFVAAMFMEIGLLWRKYESIIKKYTPFLLVVSGAYWFSHTMRGDFVELWTRFYAGYEVSILVAVAGTFLVSNFSMMLEESLKKAGKIQKYLTNSFVFIGKNTMLLYMVHCFDTLSFARIWDVRRECDGFFIMLTILLRLMFNLVVFAILYYILYLLKHKPYCKKH